MIRWCSYCQRFMDEKEPYDNYLVTHGVCADCLGKDDDHLARAGTRVAPIAAFYAELRRTVLGGAEPDLEQLLARCQAYGGRPMDLMMGMLQPLLYEIGDLWAQGRITVAIEHRFSALAGELIKHFQPSGPARAPGRAPSLVLLPAWGNHHILGLEMARSYFAASGFPAQVETAWMSTSGLLDQLERQDLKALGFSVALPAQMEQVYEVAQALGPRGHRTPRILVGGPAVRRGLELRADLGQGIRLCMTLQEAAALGAEAG